MGSVDAESRQAPATFGGLLREHRLAIGLTQQALAERGVTEPYPTPPTD